MQQTTLPFLIASRAKSNPNLLFIEEINGARLTYAEAETNILRWADIYRGLGITRGDIALSMLPPSATGICSWLGLGRVGAIDAAVGVEYKGSLLGGMIRSSGARIMLTIDRYVAPILESLKGSDHLLKTMIVVDGETPKAERDGITLVPAIELLSSSSPVAQPFPEHFDIACIIHTSGTTGTSKGVLVPWAQLHANCLGSIELYDPSDAYYSPFPLSHASGRLPVYFTALVGGRLILRERFSGSEFWRDVCQYRCTTTSMPGTMAALLLAQALRPEEQNNPLRFVTMAPLIADLDKFKARFGVEVRTMFNQTELSSPISSVGTRLADYRSCGRVRAGYEVRLVDENDLEVELGATGELIVRSEQPWVLMAGYWQRPEATAQAWRNGWFHTGDLFTRDAAGNFYYVDRRKDCIRRRGENISSIELERIVNEHPDVLESAAVGVPADLGEEEIKLVVLARPGRCVHPDALLAYLENRVPRFMVPRYVDLVTEMPRTPAMQRIQKVRLREAGVTATTWDREKATKERH